jgi:phthiodiolone/phenolphthiodiolone dimycocerosates ketoreductase
VNGPAETALLFTNNRMLDLRASADYAVSLANLEAVDYFWTFDELSGWFPRSMWLPQIAPMAAVLDINATNDPFLQCAAAVAANPDASVRLTTDAVRARPAELTRAMAGLANSTTGRAVCAIGAGEQRQSRPFGYKRSEGLARLEDVLRLHRMLLDADEPFDFSGNIWQFKNAYIGSTGNRRPELWALGGGPKLIELAAKYADGFETCTPLAIPDVDRWAQQVRDVRGQVEAAGRDPDTFGFGIWIAALMHDDPQVINAALDNPLLSVFAALLGRFNQRDWLLEGLTPVMPTDWHYSMRLLPFDIPRSEAEDIIARVPRAMVEKSFVIGSPAEIADVAGTFVDAGATFVGIVDVFPLLADPAEGEAAFARGVQACTLLKQREPRSVTACSDVANA